MNQKTDVGNDPAESQKKIRNRIRKFQGHILLVELIRFLHDQERKSPEHWAKATPWNIVLLIKWVLMFGELDNKTLREPTLNEFIGLLNSIQNASDYIPMRDDYGSPRHFLKALAHQQFWYQTNDWAFRMLMERRLFAKGPKAAQFGAMFESLVGIPILKFLDLSLFTIGRFWGPVPELAINTGYFKPISDHYPESLVLSFLDLISADTSEISDFLNHSTQIRDVGLQFYEKSPLIRYPLLRTESGFVCYSSRIIASSLSGFVHDFLKREIGESFSRTLGVAFEYEVENTRLQVSSNWLNENRLKKLIPKSKTVDNVGVFDDALVLVESKSIQLSELAMVSFNPAVTLRAVRNSVLKAIEQGIVTSHSLRQISIGQDVPRERRFLLIVSYDDLNIGHASEFLTDDFRNEIFDQLEGSGYSMNEFLEENIVVVSALDMERLGAMIKNTSEDLGSFLEGVAVASNNAKTARWNLRDYISEKYPGLEPLDSVKHSRSEVFKLSEKIKSD